MGDFPPKKSREMVLGVTSCLLGSGEGLIRRKWEAVAPPTPADRMLIWEIDFFEGILETGYFLGGREPLFDLRKVDIQVG